MQVQLQQLSSKFMKRVQVQFQPSHDYSRYNMYITLTQLTLSCRWSFAGSSTSSGRKLMQQMSGEPEPLMKWLVDKHNELRYRHGVQLLTWDWSLAWNAYNWVVGCPNSHSGQQGIGENLAWGHQDFNHAMRDWYDEVGGALLTPAG